MALLLNSTSSSHEDVIFVDILTANQADMFLLVNIVMLCTVTTFLGIFGNIINLLVFLKQGFHNTINICFFGLAVSDICCLVTLLWTSICLNPLVLFSGAPWVPIDFIYLTGAWPHQISGRITSYITVYITAERCLCIIFPLKVKRIITPTKTTVSVCVIYVLNILMLCPEYVTSYLAWTFFPEYNRTLLALAYLKGREETNGLIYFLNSISGLISFVSVIVLTAILVVNLQKASIWRTKITSANSSTDAMSIRDQKTVKMVALIATVLIVCYTPGVVAGLVTFIEPEFDRNRRYANTMASFWTIACICQAVNSSINIFLYYRMSSKYRATFQIVLGTSGRQRPETVHVIEHEYLRSRRGFA